MKQLLFFSFILLSFPVFGNDTIPSLDLLFESIDSFYTKSARAEAIPFQAQEELGWMKYAPGVGLTYTVAGSPRPSVSWSTNVIYNARQDKNNRLAMVDGIYRTNELQSEIDKRKVVELVREYEYLIEDLKFANEMISIDRELFELLKRKFEDGDLDSSSWLKAQKDLKTKEYNLFTKDRDILKLKSEILITAKWGNP